MEEKYALFTGKIGEYGRNIGDNKVELKAGVAKKIPPELAKYLKDCKDVVVFTVDKKPVSFREKMIREDYHELVKKHGVKKAAEIRREQG